MINRNDKVSENIGIYVFINKINNKKYIGQAVNINKRFHRHLAAAFNRNEDTHLYRALRKYDLENFDFEVLLDLDWLKSYSKDEKKKYMDIWERFMIMYHKSNNREFGYNLTNGGDGTLGYKWPEEKKEKQSEIQHIALIKYFQTEKGKEQAKEHSVRMTGRKQPEEVIEKRRKKLKKVEHTEEWNRKVGNANRNRHKVWDDETHTTYHMIKNNEEENE